MLTGGVLDNMSFTVFDNNQDPAVTGTISKGKLITLWESTSNNLDINPETVILDCLGCSVTYLHTLVQVRSAQYLDRFVL